MNEDQLLTDIAEDPDVGPRLMFADWLEEQGDPRVAFVRVVVEGGTEAEYRAAYGDRDIQMPRMMFSEAEWPREKFVRFARDCFWDGMTLRPQEDDKLDGVLDMVLNAEDRLADDWFVEMNARDRVSRTIACIAETKFCTDGGDTPGVYAASATEWIWGHVDEDNKDNADTLGRMQFVKFGEYLHFGRSVGLWQEEFLSLHAATAESKTAVLNARELFR